MSHEPVRHRCRKACLKRQALPCLKERRFPWPGLDRGAT
jgi:hypothetical protein